MTGSACLKVNDIALLLEQLAPLRLQESYDNAGLQVGNRNTPVTGVLLCTDITPAVLDEAISRSFNMVVSHHPLIFHGLKHLTESNYIERIVAKAIRHNIALYSCHTNIDSVRGGVSWRMAEKLGMTDVEVLDTHPADPEAGLGVIGSIAPQPAESLLQQIKHTFAVEAVRYAGALNTTVSRVALCGGAGSFLLDKALERGAQLYVTADLKYHDFARSYEGIIVADIGHYESEQFTKEIFRETIKEKHPSFAVEFAREEANQIKYL